MMRLTRREFLSLTSAMVTSVGLAACKPIQLPTPSTVTEPTLPQPRRILLIGDGFLTSGNASLDAFLKGLAGSAEPPLLLETSSVYLWGSLKEHWDDGDALAAIQSGDWDVVVLEQDLAAAASNVQYFEKAMVTYQETVRQFHAAIAESGAQTILLASAEYRFAGKKNAEDFYLVTAQVAEELNAKVAPVGFAFAHAKAADPNLVLYGGGEALNSLAGVYLTAAVLYATIYDRSPEGMTWLPTDDLPDDKKAEDLRRTLTIPPETRDLLLRVAWETVQETTL